LRLRHGGRAHGHDPLRRGRPAALLLRRSALFGAVPMKVLLPWLRRFVPVSGTAQELAHALALAGIAVDRIDGDLLELDLTSNRPDCLSHYGVARELAAITGQKLL